MRLCSTSVESLHATLLCQHHEALHRFADLHAAHWACVVLVQPRFNAGAMEEVLAGHTDQSLVVKREFLQAHSTGAGRRLRF